MSINDLSNQQEWRYQITNKSMTWQMHAMVQSSPINMTYPPWCKNTVTKTTFIAFLWLYIVFFGLLAVCTCTLNFFFHSFPFIVECSMIVRFALRSSIDYWLPFTLRNKKHVLEWLERRYLNYKTSVRDYRPSIFIQVRSFCGPTILFFFLNSNLTVIRYFIYIFFFLYSCAPRSQNKTLVTMALYERSIVEYQFLYLYIYLNEIKTTSNFSRELKKSN